MNERKIVDRKLLVDLAKEGVLRPAAEDGAASRLPGRHLGGRAPESGECDGRKCFHVCKFIGQWSDSVFQNPCTKIRINR